MFSTMRARSSGENGRTGEYMSAYLPCDTPSMFIPSFFSVPSMTNLVSTTPIEPVSVEGSATIACAGIEM